MKMKKLLMSLLLIGVLPLSVVAQDDMYFVPTKENKAKEVATYGIPAKTYYSGSSRSVDDYNQRIWTSVTPIDSTGNDIIEFSAVRGVYPDSTYSEVEADNDYQLTRRMSRFDDYTPSQAYWDGYRAGRWSSPWYYGSWYDPWYWNDPWYYGSYYGWHSPWYYSSWYSPWYYGGLYSPWYYGYYGWNGRPWYYVGSGGGSSHHASRPIRRITSSGRTFGYPSGSHNSGSNSSNRSFGSPTRNSSSGSSSFGSSHSGGGFSGGHSGGGGRSASGGRTFGGRR